MNTFRMSAKSIILNDLRTFYCPYGVFRLDCFRKSQPQQVTSSEVQDGLLPTSTFESRTTSRRVLRLPAAIDARLTRLCLGTLVRKMRVRTVGNQGLILRGTFRAHFTFHSWQAEMGCQRLLREKPAHRHALHRSRL